MHSQVIIKHFYMADDYLLLPQWIKLTYTIQTVVMLIPSTRKSTIEI